MKTTIAKSAALSIAAVGSLLVVPAAVHASQASAAAVPVSCAGMVNPVNATGTATAKSAAMPNGQTLELRYGRVGSTQYAWSRILNSRNGDRLWIDISGTGGSSWTQCDLRTLNSARNYGNALKTSSSSQVCMRAGARPAGASSSYLTDWWC
ncbi:hypothetical protein [Sphaerisporangium sp. TRM90804]|uniref:hypothetical protein n=1 Tax=Sphaerisporangium sp. TRM90804 TaxID=3031113 RepID=UPI00244B2607|nr:hypothetical protein [Sphaerisporangium sp. TRM90804]MDH2427593.1 hypothetical protein [Sphaerisporangium sp. TRM90804]